MIYRQRVEGRNAANRGFRRRPWEFGPSNPAEFFDPFADWLEKIDSDEDVGRTSPRLAHGKDREAGAPSNHPFLPTRIDSAILPVFFGQYRRILVPTPMKQLIWRHAERDIFLYAYQRDSLYYLAVPVGSDLYHAWRPANLRGAGGGDEEQKEFEDEIERAVAGAGAGANEKSPHDHDEDPKNGEAGSNRRAFSDHYGENVSQNDGGEDEEDAAARPVIKPAGGTKSPRKPNLENGLPTVCPREWADLHDLGGLGKMFWLMRSAERAVPPANAGGGVLWPWEMSRDDTEYEQVPFLALCRPPRVMSTARSRFLPFVW